MEQEWTEDEVMVHHAIIDFFEWYPFERIVGINSDIIQECTGLSYSAVDEAMSGLERKGVISIENGMISLLRDQGYHSSPICLEQEWQRVLLQVKDLRERLSRISLQHQTMSVHIRGRIGRWTTTAIQKALGTVEKYSQGKVAMRENLLFAQVLLWQVAAALEAVENGQEMGASIRGLAPKPGQDAPSAEKGRTQ